MRLTTNSLLGKTNGSLNSIRLGKNAGVSDHLRKTHMIAAESKESLKPVPSSIRPMPFKKVQSKFIGSDLRSNTTLPSRSKMIAQVSRRNMVEEMFDPSNHFNKTDLHFNMSPRQKLKDMSEDMSATHIVESQLNTPPNFDS